MNIKGIEYRKYDDHYYVSCDGDVYSTYSHKHLKHNIDCDGYHRVDIHGRHTKVHKLVYLTWREFIADGTQVNHLDDNKDNNHYTNLYAGTQKENIADCKRNNHRCGNVFNLTIRDKETGEISTYKRINDFIKTTGHTCANGSITHIMHRNWFVKKYEILNMERCRDYRKLISE